MLFLTGGCCRERELAGFETMESLESGVSAFKLMDTEASAIRPGSDGLVFLPYMAGERSPIWDENAKGVFFGLDYSKSRAHMIRSVLEGCAFALLHNLRTAEETGLQVRQMNAMGGAANSLVWTQIKSDVTGRRIAVPSSDTATSLGAAILAGVGTGLYKSFNEAVARTITITRIHEPDPSHFEKYQACYEIYLDIYDRLKGTMKKAAAIQAARE
jgi:xylulokinase